MALLQCSFFSESLRISSSMNVLLPQNAAGTDREPAVLYLLHGMSDDHSIWLRRTSIERYAAAWPLAVVMPAVNRSCYADMAHGAAYWTFVSEELPRIVQSFFKVSADPRKTFVAGLSMGGFGAFKLALEHPERFAAAASLSGCLDMRALTARREVLSAEECENIFGPHGPAEGSIDDLPALAGRSAAHSRVRFYQCCGTGDFLYQDNLVFRDQALRQGLNLLYEEHAGQTHEWGYWDRQIERVLRWLPLEQEIR